MKETHHNKRFMGALVVTAFLTAMFMLLAQYSGAGAQEYKAGTVSGLVAPARETEIEPTETETHGGHDGTRTPEATETEHPRETEQPHETETPEGTEGPHETRTAEVEPTETEGHGGHDGTRTPEPTETGGHGGGHDGTRTPESEPSETEGPHETHTPGVDPTETEVHHGSPTPQATGTIVPPPLPTGQAPAAGNNSNASTNVATVPGTGSRLFAETGKTVNGLFLSYWDANGGLAQQGFPISGVMQEQSSLNGKIYTTQYFERTVFEFHPENAAPYNVLLSQLGTFRYNQKYPNGAPDQTVNKTNAQYFAETKHSIGGSFLTYWQQHGGIAQEGLPISDEFTEISALDGKPYTVQYFERAVFEMHPENATPYNVLLSQLGTFQYNAVHSK